MDQGEGMSQLVRILGRGWTVLREHGLVSFVWRAREYLRRVKISASGIEVSYQTGTRIDFEERLKLLEEAVPKHASSLLDLGCAEGHLTAEFADRGLFSIGIERQAHVVASARKSNADHPNLGFLEFEVTSETIDTLPYFDVVFLLTVYHHWVNEFGWETAENMLRIVGSKCETLVFEHPDTTVDRPAIEGVDEVDTERYFKSYFAELFENEVVVKVLGLTDYKGGQRQDIICVIDTTAVGRSN